MTALLDAAPWLGLALAAAMGAVLALAALGVRSAGRELAEREAAAGRRAAELDRRYWELWRREMASLHGTALHGAAGGTRR
jgi:hypothetical protein